MSGSFSTVEKPSTVLKRLQKLMPRPKSGLRFTFYSRPGQL